MAELVSLFFRLGRSAQMIRKTFRASSSTSSSDRLLLCSSATEHPPPPGPVRCGLLSLHTAGAVLSASTSLRSALWELLRLYVVFWERNHLYLPHGPRYANGAATLPDGVL